MYDRKFLKLATHPAETWDKAHADTLEVIQKLSKGKPYSNLDLPMDRQINLNISKNSILPKLNCILVNDQTRALNQTSRRFTFNSIQKKIALSKISGKFLSLPPSSSCPVFNIENSFFKNNSRARK